MEKLREFANKVLTALIERGYNVEITEVEKLNNRRLIGILLKTESGINPTVYLEKFFKDVEYGIITLSAAVDDIIDALVRASKPNDALGGFDSTTKISDFISSFAKAKDNITAQLINKELNREFLKNKVYLEVMEDLAVVFRVTYSEGPTGVASTVITKEISESWGISAEELLSIAMDNMYPKTSIIPIMEVLKQMGAPVELFGPDDLPMFVLKTDNGINGAATILSEKVQKDIIEELGNVLIIPSSIHELLLIPETELDEKVEAIASMIKEVNAAELLPEEILSDHPYFLRKEDKITIEAA